MTPRAELRSLASARLIDPLKAAFARTSPRERALLSAGGLIAVFYALVVLIDWNAARREDYADAVAARSAARLSAATAQRAAAQAAAAAAAVDLGAVGFRNRTVELVRLDAERLIVQAAATASLADARVQVSDAPSDSGAVDWLEVEVTAALSWPELLKFLDLVAAFPEGMRLRGVVDRKSVV